MGVWAGTKFVAALVAFAARWKGSKEMKDKYSAVKTLVKASVAFGLTLASGVALNVLEVFDAVELPQTWDDFTASWPILAMSLGAGVLQAVLNWYKNKDKGK